ncbi:class I SAM-dependent methyltransferase [Microcoleus sp. AT9_A2]|uniref:class I SAM-dependent methyltransferase n=1 Tax=Microcoleus sp. AT9_A2 TaxID=2818624 RepID=UPI002FCEFA77
MQIKLTRESILWAYRLLLDREPENQKAIDAQLQGAANTQELRQNFMRSQEFQNKNQQTHHLPLAGDEPPMNIENVSDRALLQVLFKHIQDTWSYLGETEPHWSVITSEQFLQSQINTTKELFYDSGRANVVQLLKTLDRNGLDRSAFKSCLEYGCGLGRVTRWLSEKFETVFGYDISRAHLQSAEHYLENQGISNINLRHVREVKDIENLPKVDVIYSAIVLQHNPPPIISLIVKEMITALNPGGVAYFQVPTYRMGYNFSLEKYLHDEATRREMEMHVLPQGTIFDIVRKEGGNIVEVLEDNWTGFRPKERSNTFVIQKSTRLV